MKSGKKELLLLFAILIITLPVTCVIGETTYVDSRNGSDTNPGTKEKPLRTIGQATVLVNSTTEPGPTTIKIAPGIYNIDKCAVFEDKRPFTEKDRLVIEAAILPNDANWKPALMPVILSTEDPRKPDKLGELTETYSVKIKVSHVTIRGLKFLGNPLSNNWHCCVERVGESLDDLLVTQCMFVGNRDTFDIYCATLVTGDRFVVDHCIFYNCHACVVFWDGQEGISGKGCSMRYCIVDGAYISGVWTCQTEEDFEFHHNIVARSEYFWIRKPGDRQKYRLHDCIVTSNRYYSGYGVASGPAGQTGPEVTYEEESVIKEGEVTLVKDKNTRNYLHVVEGTFGSELGAGVITPAVGQRSKLQQVSISEDKRSFVLGKSGEKFVPWGFNYDHDEDGRLLEDYWHCEWNTIEQDFHEMKQLGANVVRIHLQVGKFMKGQNEPNEVSLEQLVRLVSLAERLQLYLDVTGLGCYHKKDVPQWYDKLPQQQRWDVQARFWQAIAQRCASSPAIFCYDLMNEPVVGSGNEQTDWLGPAFAGKHFVQFIALQQNSRERVDIAVQWIKKLSAAIRRYDRRHLITVGLVPWSLERKGLTSGFVPEKIASELDFVSVHIYPEKDKLAEAMETLAGFSVGKPLVIEEMFPLRCSMAELEQFIEGSARFACGWIGFYWGKTPEEYRGFDRISDALMLSWLEFFQKKTRAAGRF